MTIYPYYVVDENVVPDSWFLRKENWLTFAIRLALRIRPATMELVYNTTRDFQIVPFRLYLRG